MSSPLKKSPTILPGWGPVTLLLIAMVSIQVGASLAKSLFPLVGATGITALRLGMGTIILCLLFKPWRHHYPRAQWLSLFMYGVMLGAMNYFFYLAIRTIPLGVAVALEFTGPLGLALFGARRIIDFVWVLLAVSGLIFLLPVSQNLAQADLKGALFAITAGICWAIYIVAGQRAGRGHGPATAAAGSVIGALIFVPLGLTFAESGIWHLSLVPILLALAVAILSSVLPYSLEIVAMAHIPTRTFGTLMSLEPAMAALSGILFLGETLTLVQWMALLAIIIASAGAALTLRATGTHVESITEIHK